MFLKAKQKVLLIISLFILLSCASRDTVYFIKPLQLVFLKGNFVNRNGETAGIIKKTEQKLAAASVSGYPFYLKARPQAIADFKFAGSVLLRIRDKAEIKIRKAVTDKHNYYSRILMDLYYGKLLLTELKPAENILKIDVLGCRLHTCNFNGIINKKRNRLFIICTKGSLKLAYEKKGHKYYQYLQSGEKLVIDHKIIPGRIYKLTASDLFAVKELTALKKTAALNSIPSKVKNKKYLLAARQAYLAHNRDKAYDLYTGALGSIIYKDNFPERYYNYAKLLEDYNKNREAEYFYLLSVFADREPYAAESCLALIKLYQKAYRKREGTAAFAYLQKYFPGTTALKKALSFKSKY
ncbi:MAG TPA: hypothetical protein VKS21_05760 [Spirochaetota bacterium]|nr:hypothetical protein [Spirochaetota bacterium]